MGWNRLSLIIENTTDLEIATALAILANFPEGSVNGRVNNFFELGFPNKGSPRNVAYIIHKETFNDVDTVCEAFAYKGAHILVAQMHKFQGATWHPTDEYILAYDKEKVDSSLVLKIEDKIKELNLIYA